MDLCQNNHPNMLIYSARSKICKLAFQQYLNDDERKEMQKIGKEINLEPYIELLVNGAITIKCWNDPRY